MKTCVYICDDDDDDDHYDDDDDDDNNDADQTIGSCWQCRGYVYIYIYIHVMWCDVM